MSKLLTISVAAYNVEQYIDKLFQSVLDERILDQIEVLIIDDGSFDHTANISHQYEKKYPGTVRLVSKPNGGHGSTINRGIIEAKGRYFRALDGDDWLDTDSLVYLIRRLQDTDAEMILTNYYECYENGTTKKISFQGLENGKKYPFAEVASKITWMRYHTVIYKTQVLKKQNIRLDEHCFYVDAEFMIYPIPYVESIAYFDCGLYCYRLGLTGQSVSPESRMKHAPDSYKVSKSLLRWYRSLPSDMEESKRKYICDGVGGHCIWHFRTIMTFPPSTEKKKELLCYESMIYKVAPDVYRSMECFKKQSQLVIAMRKSNYALYPLIGQYKRIKNNLK